MIRSRLRTGLAALAVTAAVMLSGAPAGAVTPPQVDPQAAAPTGDPGPVQPMTQRNPCVVSSTLPGTDPGAVSPNQLLLNLSEAWTHGRGDGQTVAVIDTGVQPGPRLPDVQPGGDFVGSTDGLTDCDGPGTLVAGLIAGQPGEDGFSGVAPGARIIAIRQNSPRYGPRSPGDDPVLSRAALDIATLARAVVRAADLGARVINISTVTCLPANRTAGQDQLGAALKYAAVEKDAVIIAAAGNIRGGIVTGSACESNPSTDPSRPDDPRNWSAVTSVSVPSWWQPYVLSVGSLSATGQPSDFTMAGPWLGIAAPGEQIASIGNGPDGAPANALPDDQQELHPISGTSYAAAYVSGIAALVRGRFPELTATQVVHRLTATARAAARAPSSLVGAGTVDPVAALTWELPADSPSGAGQDKPIAAPEPSGSRDSTTRSIAFAGTGALALLVLATATVAAHRRKDHS